MKNKMNKILSLILIFLIILMPLASAFSVLNNIKSNKWVTKTNPIFSLNKEEVLAKATEPKLDYIPNDMISWKDDPFLKNYDLNKYNSYEEFVNSQLSIDDRIVVNGGTADEYDTSLYMIGNVSVSVILPESIGGSEDWTAEEIAQVHSEVENGINWWAEQELGAHLNFVFNYEDSVPIVDEPITQNGIDWWLLHTMSALGYGYENYGGTQYWREGVYDYVNNQKQIKNTDWGFVIFVVDSSNDIDDKFSDGTFAFSYISGPFLVMTYDNAGWGINNMDSICAHETGHIFGAGDQYASSGCTCTSRYGYLYYENQNCANSCLINESSIMKSNYPYVFANNLIDYYARGQVGWGDSNSNQILDIIDFEPQINSYFNNFENNNFEINGISNTTGMNAVNPYYSDLIINKIGNVEYSVNNGNWNSGFALDGLFDELSENYGVLYNILDWGSYLFKIRAVDRFGQKTTEDNYVELNYEYMGCSDTDEVDNIYISGFVENYNGQFGNATDECLSTDVLRQYSCSGNDIVYEDILCDESCYNGICLFNDNLDAIDLPLTPEEQCSDIQGIIGYDKCPNGYQDSNLFRIETDISYKDISAISLKNNEFINILEESLPNKICCIVDTTAPFVEFINPNSGESISRYYKLIALANDRDSKIKQVSFEYFNGNEWIFIGNGNLTIIKDNFYTYDAYIFNWDTTNPLISPVYGEVNLRVRVVDDSLNEASLIVENVFINNSI